MTLKAVTYSFIEDNRMMGFDFDTTEEDGEPGETIVMAALPKMLYPVPAKLALVAAAISIFLSVAHLGFVGTDWKSGKRVRAALHHDRTGLTNHDTDTILCFSPQHHVLAHHKRHRCPFRTCLYLLHTQKHITLSRQIRKLPRFTHEQYF
jgi:hypothetical protein